MDVLDYSCSPPLAGRPDWWCHLAYAPGASFGPCGVPSSFPSRAARRRARRLRVLNSRTPAPRASTQAQTVDCAITEEFPTLTRERYIVIEVLAPSALSHTPPADEYPRDYWNDFAQDFPQILFSERPIDMQVLPDIVHPRSADSVHDYSWQRQLDVWPDFELPSMIPHSSTSCGMIELKLNEVLSFGDISHYSATIPSPQEVNKAEQDPLSPNVCTLLAPPGDDVTQSDAIATCDAVSSSAPESFSRSGALTPSAVPLDHGAGNEDMMFNAATQASSLVCRSADQKRIQDKLRHSPLALLTVEDWQALRVLSVGHANMFYLGSGFHSACLSGERFASENLRDSTYSSTTSLSPPYFQPQADLSTSHSQLISSNLVITPAQASRIFNRACANDNTLYIDEFIGIPEIGVIIATRLLPYSELQTLWRKFSPIDAPITCGIFTDIVLSMCSKPVLDMTCATSSIGSDDEIDQSYFARSSRPDGIGPLLVPTKLIKKTSPSEGFTHYDGHGICPIHMCNNANSAVDASSSCNSKSMVTSVDQTALS